MGTTAEDEMEYLATIAASFQFAEGVLLLVAVRRHHTKASFKVILITALVILFNEFHFSVLGPADGRDMKLQGGLRLDIVYSTAGVILSLLGLFVFKRPDAIDDQPQGGSRVHVGGSFLSA